MGKFTFIVFIIYTLYYAANIAYDLFFKKNALSGEPTEEHTFDHIENYKKIGIDDVENADVPESYIVNDLWNNIDDVNSNEDLTEISVLKEIYEVENEIENQIENQLDRTVKADFNNTKDVIDEEIDTEKEEYNQDSSDDDFINGIQQLNATESYDTSHENMKSKRAKNKYKSRPKKYLLDEYKALMSDNNSSITVVAEIDGKKIYGTK